MTLPPGSQPYLRFRHAWGFDSNRGGVPGRRRRRVLDDRHTWAELRSSGSRDNGYNGTLNGAGTTRWPAKAFVDDSRGYISSRADLLLPRRTGRPVPLPHSGEDRSGGGLGWYVDDVRLYTCAPGPGDVTQAVDEPTVTVGDDIDLHVTVAQRRERLAHGVTEGPHAPDCAGPRRRHRRRRRRSTVDCTYATVDPDDTARRPTGRGKRQPGVRTTRRSNR